MNRTLTIYIVLIALVLGLIIYADASKPEPINWTPTYNIKDKIPLGLYVFNHEAPKLLKGDTLNTFSITPYEYFNARYDYDTEEYTAKGTYLYIGGDKPMDKESVNELLTFADYGNTVVLSATEFPQVLLDTLNLKVSGRFYADSLQLSLVRRPEKKYLFTEGANLMAFDSISPDSIKAGKVTLLGYQDIKGNRRPNFIQLPFGNGRILLHTQPAAFTNYYLLKKEHYNYAQDVAYYIPKGTVYWHNGTVNDDISGSPFRYILSQPALKWALWLSLMGLVVFIFFNAKRKQRIIATIDPVRNTTVDFAKTIGNLYFMEGNHHTIIEKKIIYFLERMRTEYLIDTYSLDETFIEKLHLKTGKPTEDIEKAVSLIKQHRHNFASTEADVVAINNAIENLRL